MNYKIETLSTQNPLAEFERGVVLLQIKELGITVDAWTSFIFNDIEPNSITLIQEDPNFLRAIIPLDLSKHGMTYNDIIERLRPVFDKQYY